MNTSLYGNNSRKPLPAAKVVLFTQTEMVARIERIRREEADERCPDIFEHRGRLVLVRRAS